MKIQNSKLKVKRFFKILFTVHCSLFTLFLLFTVHYSLFTDTAAASEKWGGVDESIVEKYAKEHGREAMTPLINTDQGDLLLFVFLLAGAVGGFAAGYYWRELTESRAKNTEHRAQTETK